MTTEYLRVLAENVLRKDEDVVALMCQTVTYTYDHEGHWRNCLDHHWKFGQKHF